MMFDILMFKGKKIFISGGAGVIGNYLVRKLYEAGAVLFVGDLKPFPDHWAKDIAYRRGDLNYITKEELDSFAPEYFFHLAATFERTKETFEFWEENFTHNVSLSNHLMSLFKKSETLRRVVFASSYLIYDENQYLFESPAIQPVQLAETATISPRNICGAAKLLHETELHFLSQFNTLKFSTVSARIYRSFGKNSRDIISRWIRMLIRDETIEIYNKESFFDYIYAEEVAEGLLRLAVADITGIVNLGSGKARRISEVFSILQKYFPKLKYVEHDPMPPFEASQADMQKAYTVLNWMPIKQVEQGIEEIIEFEKNHDQIKEDGKSKNILITSSSSKISLVNSVKKAVAKVSDEMRVYSADSEPCAVSQYFTGKFWSMPKITEISTDEIISYCKNEHIGFIIPTRDGELKYFAGIKQELENENIFVMVPNLDTVNICLNKQLFYQKCKSLGLPAIETAENISSIKAQRYVVKERYGAGSKSIGLGLSKDEAVFHAKSLQAPVFQPFIEGKEYSIDTYLDRNGNIKGIISRERIKVSNGEAKITQKVDNLQLESITARLVQQLVIYGHSVTQIIIDTNTTPHIVECNSRFGGASALSIACGLDSFYWFLLESMGEDISKYPFIKDQRSLKMIKYETELIV